ncbi:MAG: hypothetical protein UT55_C0087G0009 [Candidatus Peregrinibacteria bacterium GW2011_GWE2_39_6]|nr:MAG: hypothetical protein UT36_C0001G0057 [Candidatus Peregrinibacteria bacterium GW2011_GWF2_39_17]KKR23612.1 MAG: hypothetical protein UT55_C0087G0009 [Candidatus Peregrinibacteria bacterium GW2011_GWE2_39_6]HCW32398.1 hypothetical protein [Candidatus Peregrinibacteria bacterium]
MDEVIGGARDGGQELVPNADLIVIIEAIKGVNDVLVSAIEALRAYMATHRENDAQYISGLSISSSVVNIQRLILGFPKGATVNVKQMEDFFSEYRKMCELLFAFNEYDVFGTRAWAETLYGLLFSIRWYIKIPESPSLSAALVDLDSYLRGYKFSLDESNLGTRLLTTFDRDVDFNNFGDLT